jgi:TP901 family phage tail tape measure protein
MGPQGVIASLLIKLGMDPSGVAQGATSAQRTMAGLQKHATAATAFAGAAVGDFVAASSQQWVRFDDQMRQVLTILPDKSDAAFNTMKGQVRDLAKEFGVVANDVIPGLYDALSSGIDQTDIGSFMRTAQKMAVAGVSTTQESVNLLTQVKNAYRLEMADMTKVSDQMFNAVNKGVTTIPELSSAMSAVTPIASAMGIGVDEVLATITAMTLQGASTSEAVTMMRSSLVALLKPLPPLKAGLERAGFASGQAAIDALGYQGAMELVRDISEQTGITLPKLTGRIEGTSAVLMLTGQNAEAAGEALDYIRETAGSTDDAFRIMQGGIGGTIRRMQAGLADLQLTVGQVLEPMAPLFMAFGPQIGRWIGRGIGAGLALAGKAALPILSRLAPSFVDAATQLGIEAGGGMGKGLVQSVVSSIKGAGAKKLLAGAGLIIGGQVASGMAAGEKDAGVAAAMGGLGAVATIAGAFAIGGPVLAGITAIVLAVQQLLTFLDTVGKAQADLTTKASEAANQSGEDALANLKKLTASMHDAQGFQRVIGDTFGGAQQVEALRNLSTAITKAESLTTAQIEDAIASVSAAVVEAEARGNSAIAGQLRTNITTLEQMKAEAAKTGGVWTAPTETLDEAEAAAMGIEQGGDVVAGAVGSAGAKVKASMADVRSAVSSAWDAVTSALSKGPKVQTFTKRMATIRKAIEQNVRGLRRAVRAGDSVAAAEYTSRIKAAQEARAEIVGNQKAIMQEAGAILGRHAARAKRQQQGMTKTTEREARKAARVAERQARRQSKAVPEAMADQKPKVATVAEQTATAVETPLTNAATAATTWGSHLGANFAAGISSQYGAAIRAAESLAGAVHSRMGFSAPPKKGPLSTIRQWGPHMVMEWVKPIDRHIRDVEKRGDRLGRAVRPKWARDDHDGPRGGSGGGWAGRGRSVDRMRVAHMAVRDLRVRGGRGGGDVHYHIGTLIANEAGLGELDRRTLRRRRLSKRAERDPERY